MKIYQLNEALSTTEREIENKAYKKKCDKTQKEKKRRSHCFISISSNWKHCSHLNYT